MFSPPPPPGPPRSSNPGFRNIPKTYAPKEPANLEDLASESMDSLGTRFAKQGDVSHVCKALEATVGDVWLVESIVGPRATLFRPSTSRDFVW